MSAWRSHSSIWYFDSCSSMTAFIGFVYRTILFHSVINKSPAKCIHVFFDIYIICFEHGKTNWIVRKIILMTYVKSFLSMFVRKSFKRFHETRFHVLPAVALLDTKMFLVDFLDPISRRYLGDTHTYVYSFLLKFRLMNRACPWEYRNMSGFFSRTNRTIIKKKSRQFFPLNIFSNKVC